MSSNQTSKSDAQRIQSTQRRADQTRTQQATGGKDMSKGGFAARAQSAGDRNANAVAGSGAGGSGSGTGGGQAQGQGGDKAGGGK
ncbi:MAG: hypothetical protein ALECFALPRED_008067 [Alectoria fallacina]|uniref:SMP domain-containing protein n=1 Tax=Alectoria fallacina TaxID=1903189 RepID=A0A8H3J234_9LECA|nr:MAG: hypothetical protein ALECFALPRED_008067 [Alectoria fallacina]